MHNPSTGLRYSMRVVRFWDNLWTVSLSNNLGMVRLGNSLGMVRLGKNLGMVGFTSRLRMVRAGSSLGVEGAVGVTLRRKRWVSRIYILREH